MQTLTLEQWGLLVSLLLGAGALYYAKLATRASVKQLELAREEALRHPNLEVGGVSLKDAEGFQELSQTRAAQRAWQDALAGNTLEEFVETLLDPQNSSFSLEQAQYDEPFPDLILFFELRNRGNRTAKEVSGKLTFDPNALQPLDFPGFDGAVSEHQEGMVRLSVGTVSSARSGEVWVYRVALLSSGSGRTTARAVFSTPEGDHWEQPLELDLP